MKPSLFNTDMVCAILDGRKTVTRRSPFQPGKHSCLKGLYRDDKNRLCALFHRPDDYFAVRSFRAPHQAGDILYVRETFFEHKGHFYYKAGGKYEALAKFGIILKWRPSIHMPRKAARIFLRVTSVRVERLQEITGEGVLAEGIQSKKPEWALIDFADAWNSTIKPADLDRYGWDADPWVWVIEFEKLSREEADP